MEQSFSRTTKLVVFALAAVAFLFVAFYTIGRWQIRQDISSLARTDLENYQYNPSSIPNINIASGNLTTNLTSKIVKTEALANVGGSEKDNGLIVPSSAIVDQIADSALKDFSPEKFIPPVSDEDIIISSDNSTIALNSYIERFNSIINQNSLSSQPLSSASTVNDTIKKMIDIYRLSASALQSLPVPSQLKELHRREISLLFGKAFALEKIIIYETDPLLALVALNANSYFDNELQKLKGEFNSYLADKL